MALTTKDLVTSGASNVATTFNPRADEVIRSPGRWSSASDSPERSTQIPSRPIPSRSKPAVNSSSKKPTSNKSNRSRSRSSSRSRYSYSRSRSRSRSRSKKRRSRRRSGSSRSRYRSYSRSSSRSSRSRSRSHSRHRRRRRSDSRSRDSSSYSRSRSRSRSRSNSRSRSRRRKVYKSTRSTSREIARIYNQGVDVAKPAEKAKSKTPPPEGTRIYIADLSPDFKKSDVEKIFEKYGKLKHVWLNPKKPCYGFVTFETKEEANLAVREVYGRIIHHQRFIVSIAKPPSKDKEKNR